MKAIHSVSWFSLPLVFLAVCSAYAGLVWIVHKRGLDIFDRMPRKVSWLDMALSYFIMLLGTVSSNGYVMSDKYVFPVLFWEVNTSDYVSVTSIFWSIGFTSASVVNFLIGFAIVLPFIYVIVTLLLRTSIVGSIPYNEDSVLDSLIGFDKRRIRIVYLLSCFMSVGIVCLYLSSFVFEFEPIIYLAVPLYIFGILLGVIHILTYSALVPFLLSMISVGFFNRYIVQPLISTGILGQPIQVSLGIGLLYVGLIFLPRGGDSTLADVISVPESSSIRKMYQSDVFQRMLSYEAVAVSYFVYISLVVLLYESWYTDGGAARLVNHYIFPFLTYNHYTFALDGIFVDSSNVPTLGLLLNAVAGLLMVNVAIGFVFWFIDCKGYYQIPSTGVSFNSGQAAKATVYLFILVIGFIYFVLDWLSFAFFLFPPVPTGPISGIFATIIVLLVFFSSFIVCNRYYTDSTENEE